MGTSFEGLVEISLSISLARGRFLNINGEKQWIPIKFEKLLNYASSAEKLITVKVANHPREG